MSKEEMLNETMCCTCDVAYKSRGLAAPDCAYCNYSDDILEIMGTFAKQESIAFAEFFIEATNAEMTLWVDRNPHGIKSGYYSITELFTLYSSHKVK